MADRTSARELDEIYSLLSKRLSPSRLLHTLGAAHVAVGLARRWGADPERALKAALLHDVAKELDHDALLARIERHLRQGMHPDDRDFPDVWHALAGEIVAGEELGVSCPEVAAAIRLHPTGDGEMRLLEKIIFLADYIEPTRARADAGALRELALENLDAATDAAILEKTRHVRKRGRPLHTRSLRALGMAEGRAAKPEAAAKGKETA